MNTLQFPAKFPCRKSKMAAVYAAGWLLCYEGGRRAGLQGRSDAAETADVGGEGGANVAK